MNKFLIFASFLFVSFSIQSMEQEQPRSVKRKLNFDFIPAANDSVKIYQPKSLKELCTQFVAKNIPNISEDTFNQLSDEIVDNLTQVDEFFGFRFTESSRGFIKDTVNSTPNSKAKKRAELLKQLQKQSSFDIAPINPK